VNKLRVEKRLSATVREMNAALTDTAHRPIVVEAFRRMGLWD
jgi:hypothetical protein